MSHRFARFIIVSVLLGIVAPLCPAAEQAAASAITFALKKPGKVTLNIYDSRGRLVRELFGGQPLEAGEHAIPWDGLDYMNRPLDPASYSWKAIVHDGVKAEWMAAVGNSGTPPYQTADNTGSWGGDHGGACAVAADDSGFYFLWADAEAGMSALKLDRNDRTVWRHKVFVFDCKTAIGTDGRHVFIGIVRDGGDCVLARYDAATGRSAPFPSGREWISMPQKAKLERGWTRAAGLRPGTPEPEIVPPAKPRSDPWIAQANYLRRYADNPSGIQVRNGKVYVSMCHENMILVFDAEKGELLGSLDVPLPRGIAFAPNGSLLAISVVQDETGTVVRIDPATGKSATVVSDGLEIPWGLACDKDGNFYVSDRGLCQQVKKFSADGKLLLAFGRLGGRLDGKYEGADIREASGICIAPDGFLYVPEGSAPKRIGRFTLDGKPVKEWFGAMGYASPAFADPADARSVYYAWGGALMRARVDYATKQWTVDAVWNASLPEGVTRGFDDMRVLHANGRTYVYGEGHAHPLFIVDGYSLRQVAAAGKHAGYLQPHSAEWYDETFTWFDANGNGKVDGDELNVVKSPVGGRMNGLIGSYLTDKLVWYLPDFNRVLRLRPLEIDKTGAPRYLWSLKVNGIAGVDIPVKQLDPEIGGESTGCEVDSAGNIYAIWNVGGQTRARSYWGARCVMNRVAKYSPEGTLIWEAGRHCSGDYIKPGEMYHIWKTAGIVDDYVFITDTNGLYHIYTTDGFFVDTLMNDPSRPDSPPGPYTLMSENFCGGAARDAKSGKILLFASDTAGHVYEVKGLSKFTRLNGTVRLAGRPGFPGEAIPPGAAYPIARIPRKSLLYREGLANDWDGIPGITLRADGVPVAQVKVAVDDERLHIVAQVFDASPLRNNADPVQMAFAGGDEVSVCLGCDAAADQGRKEPAPGDVRIVLAAPAGKPQVICYKPVDPAGTAATRYEVQSGVGKVVFASVTSNPAGGYCASKLWSDGRGYTVEADVPLSVFPELAGSWGKTIRFDAEVGFSDPAGNKLASRIAWHGSNAAAAASEDAPSAARMSPSAWGSALLPEPAGK